MGTGQDARRDRSGRGRCRSRTRGDGAIYRRPALVTKRRATRAMLRVAVRGKARQARRGWHVTAGAALAGARKRRGPGPGWGLADCRVMPRAQPWAGCGPRCRARHADRLDRARRATRPREGQRLAPPRHRQSALSSRPLLPQMPRVAARRLRNRARSSGRQRQRGGRDRPAHAFAALRAASATASAASLRLLKVPMSISSGHVTARARPSRSATCPSRRSPL
jgi:hypothetical protein